MELVCTNCHQRFRSSAEPNHADLPSAAACPHCGTSFDLAAHIAEIAARTTEGGTGPPTEPVADLSHRVIGDYEILEEVSRGAMGVIYKARHKTLRRVVALKVMLAGEHASPEQVARFEKEARAAAKLRHPNIVPIYEIGIAEGRRFFTMDFIDGDPLDVLIARKTLTPRQALEISATVADALAYAHSKGVIHRDIKPSNIMVDRSGQPQVMDFGLAKQIDSDTKFTHTGTTIGTPAYMPPEQARGDNKEIDQRSDVYSLGAVLYEMLSGQPPFTGETMMNIVVKVAHDEPTPLRKLVPKLHRDIQTVVQKSMEKEQRRRYQSMAEFAADLRRYLAGEMIAARPASVVRRTAKSLRKYRSPIAVGLVIAILATAVSGAIILPLLRSREEARRRAADAENERLLANAEHPPEWDVKFKDNFSEPALDPVWKPSSPNWKLDKGRLVGATPGDSYVLLDQPFDGNLIIEFSAWPQSPNDRINCFLGPSYPSSYVLRFGNWNGHSLALLHQGKLLAEIECPPLVPDSLYRFHIERRYDQLLCRVTGAGKTHELRYEAPELLRSFTTVRFGLHTSASTVQFGDVAIKREEYPAERLSKLQSVDAYFLCTGQLDKALAEYKTIAEKYPGRNIAVIAEHNSGLVLEALAQEAEPALKEALAHYRSVEKSASLLTDKDQATALKNKERIFFTLAETGQYPQAAQELAAFCDSGGRFGPGTAWLFPDLLSRCASNFAYIPALQIMQAARFDGTQPTFRDQYQAAGPRMRASFSKALLDLCTGFADQKQFDQLKAAYRTLPDPATVKPFETALSKALEANNLNAALDLLLFTRDHKMTTPPLEQAALALAERYLAAKQYARLPALYDAHPTRALAPHFDRAIAALTAASDLPAAIDFLRRAAETFPQDQAVLANAAGPLITACLKASHYVDARYVHALCPDPRFVPLVIQAAAGQLGANNLTEARETLEHLRQTAPAQATTFNPLAADLAARFLAAGQADRALDLFAKYPGPRMVEPLAAAFAAATQNTDLERLARLITIALNSSRTEPRIAAATRTAARTLIQYGRPALLVRSYDEAARAKTVDLDAAATLRLEAADLLLAERAYLHAAQTLEAAAHTPPKTAKLAAAALQKAAALYLCLGQADLAQQVLQELTHDFPDAQPETLVARLLAGAIAPDDFQRSVANPRLLPPADESFYLALRAITDNDRAAARSFLEGALAAGKDAWFSQIAQLTLAKLPEPGPRLPPDRQPATAVPPEE